MMRTIKSESSARRLKLVEQRILLSTFRYQKLSSIKEDTLAPAIGAADTSCRVTGLGNYERKFFYLDFILPAALNARVERV